MPYLPIERRKRGRKGRINACIEHEQILIKSDKLLLSTTEYRSIADMCMYTVINQDQRVVLYFSQYLLGSGYSFC